MALYKTTGIRDTKATLANHGERSDILWSGTQAEAAKDRKWLKGLGFDVITVEYSCPKDKSELIKLLNTASNQQEK